MAEKSVPDVWQNGVAYERYVGRWSRQVATEFLSWLSVPHGRRWLDVGCGTGALSATILRDCSPASVDGVDPSAGFLAAARENLGSSATLHQASAESLPLPDSAFDAVVSGLMLNFANDHDVALTEMTRVAAAGATIGAYVWDYVGMMEFMRYFWDAAVELDPAAASLDEGSRFPLCHPDALLAFFASGGLARIEVRAIEIATPFGSFDEYWRPFLGGQGAAPSYAMSLDDLARQRLRDRLRRTLPIRADGSIPLRARAWAVRGTLA